jgi:hypothetical protein
MPVRRLPDMARQVLQVLANQILRLIGPFWNAWSR